MTNGKIKNKKETIEGFYFVVFGFLVL